MSYVQQLPQILDSTSEFFLLRNCKFANERPKRNCARLAFLRDFNLLDTYTIESSCFGFKVKGNEKAEELEEADPVYMQLTPQHLATFGKHLLQGVAKHLQLRLTDLDRAGMISGFEIEPDFCLGMQLEETKKKPSKKQKKKRRMDSAGIQNTTTQSAFGEASKTSVEDVK